ncbi:MAG: hypothetical protein R3E96_15940 [Planctomycetota bacterium]
MNTVSASGGYLTQDEYTLHFALPPDPFPGDPGRDLRMSIQVDLNSDPAEGIRRIDGCGPALARFDFADIEDREIVIYRSGKVRINGCLLPPTTSRIR